MDCQYHITEYSERRRGQHLTLADRVAIRHLHKLGYSNRAIARELNCSPSTIGNELKRGTAAKKVIAAEYRNTAQKEDRLNTAETNHAAADRTKCMPAGSL